MEPIQNILETINSNPYLAVAFSTWIVVWKGLALWKSAQKGQKPWFVAILVINTLGLLEIIYLFLVPRLKFTFPKKKK
ncbi:hypothetical protein COT64_03435 [Candidatus Shapirobacteria bacterium CG09_land_8_20_14_0_10_39_12]|uniref:DUF5652 domain-containing protein n=1 Tax=Candidatus Shapirobacteria bacterium CG09_land_8_20_14_0_10_39_12 TaxID=1974885 RepID=A0A2H0WNR7_9BACT|nr:MAG: hypothetical protein COT64_03435 [Candidatus Shapirobacteria bacterium CG09_land_8_20_14_0_10_39_12]